MQQYYSALGAKENDSPEQLRAAWLKQCKAHHPDRGGDPSKFREVTHAYKMITDASYRHEEKGKDPKEKLNVLIRHPISFEDAFFGKSVTFTINQIEFDSTYIPIIKEKEELFTITAAIPAGHMGDYRYEAPKRGCKLGDMEGDLIVMFTPSSHPKFRVSGLDVHTTESVPLDVMLKGGKIDVETMYGTKSLIVPPGTAPGNKLKIKRCGVSQLGHQCVTVDVIFPNEAELKTKPAWKDMHINWEEHKVAADPQEEMLMNLYNSLSKGTPTWKPTASR